MGMLLGSSGCASWAPFKPPAPVPTSTVKESDATPTSADLVRYLNQESRKIDSIEVNRLDLDAKQQNQGGGLSGYMACQKPRNFRMTGKAIGSPEVDFGSNDQEFWFWIKRASPPGLYHCTYTDFQDPAKAVRLPFPFQPEWVLEALGMADYGPPDRAAETFTVESKPATNGRPATFQLVQKTTSPQGQPIRKVTVFNRNPVIPGREPQVMGHYVFDANNKVVCFATVNRVKVDERTGLVYPYKVHLEWPTEQVQLDLTLDGVAMNPQLGQNAKLFTRPAIKDVKTYDLAYRPPTGNPTSGVRQVGGYDPSR
jgi:hypothetical protein